PLFVGAQHLFFAGAQHPMFTGAQHLFLAGAQHLFFGGAQHLFFAGAQHPIFAGTQHLFFAGAQHLFFAGAQQPIFAGAQHPIFAGAQKSVNQASVTTQPSAVPIDQIMEIMNRCLQQQELIFEQLRTVTRRSNDTHESSPVRSNEPTMENNSEPSPQSGGTQVTVLNTMTPANAVSTLSRQIPEFGGSEEENVLVKLVKSAKRWYDLQLGSALESWSCFKQELIKMFDRKISFYAAMQKIEARRWNYHKESFDQYAIDKLALTHRLNLPQSDVINLLIGGIMKSLLRATALTPYQCKHRRGIS
ncbi:hypothetical protein ALC57_16378, partial [Trachymyrmex cornetzi]